MHDILDAPEEKKQIKPNYRPLFIWAFLIFTGIIFKIQHWPGNGLLILISTSGITAYALSKVLFIYKTENILFLVTTLLSLVWIGILFYGLFFKDGTPYNYRGITLYFSIFFLLFAVYSVINIFKLRKLKNNRIYP